MIIYRRWWTPRKGSVLSTTWDGWFLFGILPLYLRKGVG